jgi:hypothetical protein
MALLTHFGFRVQHQTSVCANGSTDVFFTIHRDDVHDFALVRDSLLRIESSRLYAVMFVRPDVSIAEQVEFYHSNGVPSFEVTATFPSCFVVSFQLFELKDSDNIDDVEPVAQESLKLFFEAYKKCELRYPGGKSAVIISPGRLRWWEDVLRNGGDKVYSREIVERFPAQW